MRIDTLQLRNFKKFEEVTFEFPQRVDALPDGGSFHVLIGENGTGKTSILDATAVALGVWLEKVPDSLLANSRRRLSSEYKRLVSAPGGDRTLLEQAAGELAVRATGRILDQEGIQWGQTLAEGKRNISNRESKKALEVIASAYERIKHQEKNCCQ